jgi:hypothetical protein
MMQLGAGNTFMIRLSKTSDLQTDVKTLTCLMVVPAALFFLAGLSFRYPRGTDGAARLTCTKEAEHAQ